MIPYVRVTAWDRDCVLVMVKLRCRTKGGRERYITRSSIAHKIEPERLYQERYLDWLGNECLVTAKKRRWTPIEWFNAERTLSIQRSR